MKKKYVFKPSTVRVFPGQKVKIGKGKSGYFTVHYLGSDRFTLISTKEPVGYGVIAEYPSLIAHHQGIPISSLYGRELIGTNNKFREYWNQDRVAVIKVYPREAR